MKLQDGLDYQAGRFEKVLSLFLEDTGSPMPPAALRMSSSTPVEAMCPVSQLRQAWASEATPGSAPCTECHLCLSMEALPSGPPRPRASLALYPSEGHHKDRLPSRGDHAEPDHYNSRHPSSPAAACTPRPAWAPGSLRPSACSPNWSLLPHPAPLHSSSFTTLFFVVGPACSAPNSDRCCD